MTIADSESTPSTAGGPPMVLHARVVTGTGGGPEKTILNSPRFLERLGYRSECAFLHPPGDAGIEDIRRRGTAAGTEIIAIPDRGPFDWRSIRELARLCRRRNVAVWHAHDYKTNVLGLVLRRFHRMRLVTTAHGWGAIIGRVPLYNKIDLAVLPRYERIICVSDDIADRCRAAGARRERIIVIENAIDLAHYRRSADREYARRQFQTLPARLWIGAVGRLSPEKGFDRLIESVALLRERGHDAGLLIAGEGPDRQRLESLIASQRDPAHYQLAGHQPDMLAFYNAIDLFALSSLSEGLPNVLLEAMAMSLPLVATRVGGVPRLVTDRQNGLLVEPDHVARLAGALEQLISDPAAANAYGTLAREIIERKYSFERRMETIAAVYESVGITGM